jgi:single-stranded-DNA-specific exonuclease
MRYEKITKESLYAILFERIKEDRCTKLGSLYPPNLLKDTKKSAQRIKEAIENGEKIVVIGDYDADGVISSYIMVDFLKSLGAKVDLVIPNRFTDGYGISIDIMKNLQTNLIITVDNGISAHESAHYCEQSGIDLIITDHHTPSDELPLAYSIINPKQQECQFPNDTVCGAVVAWYLCAALKNEMQVQSDLSSYIDLLAIATMADLVPLKDINRTIVKAGLAKINKEPRAFIKAIMQFFNKPHITSENISFLIAPLINSAGRMSSATLAFELIDTKDDSSATKKLLQIIETNEKRKDIENEIYQEALQEVDAQSNVIVVYRNDWHEGVLGIVASKLTREFEKPAFVLTSSGDVLKGSARSVGNIDLYEVISNCSHLVSKFGGHKQAAGLVIEQENIEDFISQLQVELENIDEKEFEPNHEVIGELSFFDIDDEFIDTIESFEPYGQDNFKPKFFASDLQVTKSQRIGKYKNHQKLYLKQKNKTFEALFFNYPHDIKEGLLLDVTFTLSRVNFRENIYIQLLIEQILSYK